MQVHLLQATHTLLALVMWVETAAVGTPQPPGCSQRMQQCRGLLSQQPILRLIIRLTRPLPIPCSCSALAPSPSLSLSLPPLPPLGLSLSLSSLSACSPPPALLPSTPTLSLLSPPPPPAARPPPSPKPVPTDTHHITHERIVLLEACFHLFFTC